MFNVRLSIIYLNIMPPNKGFAPIVLLVILVGAAVLGTVTYVGVRNLPRNQELAPVTTPVPETPATTEMDTSAWKTYRNEKYGFEIRYPADFTELEDKYNTTILSVQKKIWGGNSYYGSDYFSIRVLNNYKVEQILSKVRDAKQINIKGRLGYEYFYTEGAGMSEVALVQIEENTALSVSLDSIGKGQDFTTVDDKKIYVQDLFGQIFSKLKFIEPTDISTWQAYFNSENIPPAPLGVVLPHNCQVVGSGRRMMDLASGTFAGFEWSVDCGSRNNDARGTLGPALEQQRWKHCGSGLAHADWYKNGVVTGISEGAGALYPFQVSQSLGADCSSNSNNLTLESCDQNFQCSAGFVCYHSQYSAPGPKGMMFGDEEGDLLCHKSCSTNSDCGDGAKCVEKSTWSGDVGDKIKFCESGAGRTLFKEGDYVKLNFSLCEKTEETFWVDFGSTVISVEGVQRDKCALKFGGEVENPNWNGVLNHACLVPLTEGMKSFKIMNTKVDLSPIARYCGRVE